VPANTSAEFGLDWTVNSDLDFWLYDDAGARIHDFEEGLAASESASAISLVVDTQYLVQVACWKGTDASYAMWGIW
jgi:hypothetical protein